MTVGASPRENPWALHGNEKIAVQAGQEERRSNIRKSYEGVESLCGLKLS